VVVNATVRPHEPGGAQFHSQTHIRPRAESGLPAERLVVRGHRLVQLGDKNSCSGCDWELPLKIVRSDSIAWRGCQAMAKRLRVVVKLGSRCIQATLLLGVAPRLGRAW